MKTNNVNMLSGSITKGLLAMTIPIMIMNVMQNLFTIIDMTVLKIFSDDRAVGSVGACGMLITLSTSLLVGISTGANVVVARRIGSQKKEQANRAAMMSILFAFFGGIVLMVIGVTFSETLLKMTNCSDSLLAQAVTYMKIYFCGVPISMLYSFCASLLRAIGDTKRPMYFTLSGGVAKVLFTLLFVTVFDMSVAAVACANIISNTITCTLAFATLLKGQNVLCIDFKKFKFDSTELKDMLFIGIPVGFQGALYSFANVVITSVVNSFGADATTGVSIANQFDGILNLISSAPALAITPYIAQNIGAGNIKRAKQAFLRAVLIATGSGATLGFLSAFFSGQLSSIMSSTPAVIAFSRQKMIIISSTYFICGINDVLTGVLRGMQKPIIPTASAFIFIFVLRLIWVYAIFPHCPNLTFLYAVWPIGWTLSIITLLIAYSVTMPKLQRKIELQKNIVHSHQA